MDNKLTAEMIDLLPMPPMPEGYENWLYRSISWTSHDNWNRIFDLIGEGEYKLLAMSTMRRAEGDRVRGQIWISPRGIANCIAEKERRGSEGLEE